MDAIMMARYGYYGAKTIFNTVLYPNTNKQILDPMSCIVRLALLNFKDKGTKISITNNRIYYQLPNVFQGTVRWTNGDNRNDLHNLCNPIEKAIEWYRPDKNESIRVIFEYAIRGLKKLKKAYTMGDKKIGDSSLICHSLNHYIFLLQSAVSENESERLDKLKSDNNQLRTIWESNSEVRSELRDDFSSRSKFREIWIVQELLSLINSKKRNGKSYTYLMDAIEQILQDKDEQVLLIVMQISSSI